MTKQEAKDYLTARWNDQCARFPTLREDVSLESYIDRNLNTVLRNARNRARRERDQSYRDCGMVKVRGALGGTYWE